MKGINSYKSTSLQRVAPSTIAHDVFKRIVHQKINLAENLLTLIAIQDVDDFVSSNSDLEKCSITSPMDHLQWMGAVRMRVQTADKNITMIHK